MQNSGYFLSVAVVLLGVCSAQDNVWDGTEDPTDWPKTFPQCGGKEQSPIPLLSLVADEWTLTDQKENNFEMKFDGCDEEVSVKAYNTGYLPNVTIESPSLPERPRITLTRNGETVEYFMTNIHFHWPSEHSFVTEHSALETHVVYRNHEMNRVIALAYLINECGDSTEEEVNMYTEIAVLNHIEKPGSSYSYRTKPNHFMPSDFQCGYYMYDGSFTTPPCTEGVTWFVYQQELCVNKTVIDAFKILENKNGTPIVSNNRPFQDNTPQVINLLCNDDDDDE